MSTEEIGRLVGRSSTRIIEVIYRKERRPLINIGATIIDRLFSAEGQVADSGEVSAAYLTS